MTVVYATAAFGWLQERIRPWDGNAFACSPINSYGYTSWIYGIVRTSGL